MMVRGAQSQRRKAVRGDLRHSLGYDYKNLEHLSLLLLDPGFETSSQLAEPDSPRSPASMV